MFETFEGWWRIWLICRWETAALLKEATGIAGLFLEARLDPDQALCDGPSVLPLHLIKPFLSQMNAVNDLVKSLLELENE